MVNAAAVLDHGCAKILGRIFVYINIFVRGDAWNVSASIP